jgi:hypothetical protein
MAAPELTSRALGSAPAPLAMTCRRNFYSAGRDAEPKTSITSSQSPPTVAFPVAEIGVAVLSRFRVRPAPVLRGMPCVPDPAQDRSISPDRSAGQSKRARYRMFTRQVPASTILVDAQSMAGIEMPSEHLAAPPAFDANDIIAMDGSPDRHCGCSLAPCFGCRFTEADERLMNGRD